MKLSNVLVVAIASTAIAAPVPEAKAEASPGYASYGLNMFPVAIEQIVDLI